ncbi:hypothetical protein AVEN_42994-1 [Araneus ventricosus]|uniref:Uncharacterized protein n=1 Tax=Araneus ventricosus TaxID=182803 RepID=A0A4Y2IDP6_ARAVE|nr:hypothetical protein AVEN_42994-1 [Araneus ventricosus]
MYKFYTQENTKTLQNSCYKPHESKSVAFVAKSTKNFAKNQADSVQKEKNKKIKCHYCGRPGLIKRNCYKFKNESSEKEESRKHGPWPITTSDY